MTVASPGATAVGPSEALSTSTPPESKTRRVAVRSTDESVTLNTVAVVAMLPPGAAPGADRLNSVTATDSVTSYTARTVSRR